MQDVGFSLLRATEKAAIATIEYQARGNKIDADAAAVDAMRTHLNSLNMDIRIAIGEGEIDQAPMLYIGEQLGKGGIKIDIAVDPIDGTRMVATGEGNSISVLAATPKDEMLAAPDMYMEKLAVCPQAKGVIDLRQSLVTNLKNIAAALGKPLNQLRVVTLAKPRHQDLIKELRQQEIQVFEYPDGDIIASLQTCLPNAQFDVMYCIGGAPEGIISAAAIKALGGDMQARLLFRSDVKGKNDQNLSHDIEEQQLCEKFGTIPNKVYSIDELIPANEIIFCASGISDGHILSGIKVTGKSKVCESLLIDNIGNIQKIKNTIIS